MSHGRYILIDRKPVLCDDLFTWADWLENADRIVKLTEQDAVRVSTVFLGLDHRWGPPGPPLLFESMVFFNGESSDCVRYSTWAEAERGHDLLVREVFKPRPILALPKEA